MTRKTLKKMLAGFHSEDEEENLTFKLNFFSSGFGRRCEIDLQKEKVLILNSLHGMQCMPHLYSKVVVMTFLTHGFIQNVPIPIVVVPVQITNAASTFPISLNPARLVSRSHSGSLL